MKRINLILVLFVCFTSMHAMQTGITVGYNSSDIIPLKDTYSSMPGFRIGGISQIPIDPFLLQMEVLLSSKGFMSHSIGDTRLSNLFLYCQLPLSLKYEILKKESMSIYILGGAYASLKVIAINLVSEIEGIRTVDAGIHAGFGMSFQKIGIEARYEQSFINFDLIESQKFNRSFTAGMHFYFGDK